jgi:hypothetical protein
MKRRREYKIRNLMGRKLKSRNTSLDEETERVQDQKSDGEKAVRHSKSISLTISRQESRRADFCF